MRSLVLAAPSLSLSLSLILARPVNYSLQLNKVTEVLSVRPRRRPNERSARGQLATPLAPTSPHACLLPDARRWEGHTSCLK